MKNTVGSLFRVCVLSAGLLSCGQQAPEELIDEETYQKMFIEFAIINQYDEVILQNHDREQLREEVYEHYGVSEEQFRISHEYYERDIETQLARIKDITEMLRAERDTMLRVERAYRDSLQAATDTLQ